MPKTPRDTVSTSKVTTIDLNVARLAKIRTEFYQRYAISIFKDKQKHTGESENYLRLLEKMGDEREMVARLREGVLSYARANLNQVGIGHHYTNEEANITSTREVAKNRTDTKLERVAAVNLLLEMIGNSSAKEIYDYVTTPAFRKLTGQNEVQMNVFRRHLSAVIKEFTDNYTKYLSITTDKILIDSLTDVSVLETISESDWVRLLIHYNPRLIAELILAIYGDNYIDLQLDNITITADFLQRLLSGDYAVCMELNRRRAGVNTTLMLPQGSLVAGKNTLREEQLTINQLYQYEDTTIAAIENWLYRNFSPVIANQIFDRNNQRQELNQEAPYHFYLLPTAQYMLVDPADRGALNSEGAIARYERFRKYRHDIRSLIRSRLTHRKSIIFASIMNIDSVHYIAVFIHRAKNGVMTVICVDPSPRMYPENSLQFADDPKYKSDQKLQRIYQNVFAKIPKHELRIISVDAAQMLRERDCGPNSATTLLSAMKSCLTSNPMLSINKNGELQIDVAQLGDCITPVGVNQYTGQLVYSQKLDDDSLASRAEWEKRILPIQQVYPYTIRRVGSADNPTIQDEFYLEDQIQIDFDYRESVEKQRSQDAREANLSVVRSLLLSTEEGNDIIRTLESSYQKDLNLPSTLPLENYLKEKYQNEELTSLTQAHNGSLRSLCENVTLVILKDAIPNAFVRVFENSALLNLPRTTMILHEEIVDAFIQKYQHIYTQLTIYQQSQIRTTMLQLANMAVLELLKKMHWQIVLAYMQEKMQRVLDELQVADESQLTDVVVSQLSKPTCEISDSIQFLNVHDTAKLSQWLWFEVTRTLHSLVTASVNYLTANFSTEYANLNDVLRLFATESNTFIPLTMAGLSDRLPKSVPGIISVASLATIQGKMLLDAVNQARYRLATQRLNELAYQAVTAFMQIEAVREELIQYQDYVTLTEHVYQDTGVQLHPVCIPNLEAIIAKFGSRESLTSDDYHHTLTGRYIHDNLTMLIRQFYLESLLTSFNIVKNIVLSSSPQKSYAEFKKSGLSVETYLQSLMSIALYQPARSTQLDGFSILFDGKIPAVYNHFFEWFVNTTQVTLWDYFVKFDVLIQRAELLHKILTQLKSTLSENRFNENSRLDACITELMTQIQTINSINLINIKEEQYQDALQRFNAAYKNVLTMLLSNPYVSGEIKPMSFTALVRPVLCQLFGIEVDAVISLYEAAALDARFKKAVTSPFANVLPPIAANPSGLQCLPLTTSLLNTYGMPLTREIILNFIAYWQSHYSWQYKLKHTEIWTSNDKEPAFIRLLIKFIMENQFDDEGVLTANGTQKLYDVILPSRSLTLQLALYTASDVDSQIKAALLRSSTMSNTKTSQIQFMQLVKLFNLPVANPRQHNVVVSEADIQRHTLQLLRKKREIDKGYTPNIPQLREEAKRELQGGNSRSSAKLEVFSYPPAELSRRNGLFGTQLFSGWLNQAEKTLLQIKVKHTPNNDFSLDEDDLHVLCNLMQDRWKKLCNLHHGDQELAYLHYCNPRERSDKVYIALAEMVARHYRSGGSTVYMHALLMPNYARFAGAVNLVSHELPDEMVVALGGEIGDETSLDDIPLSQLVITQNGYALNMLSIIQNYRSKFSFTNPYTKQLFSRVEIEAICMHPRAHELVDLININTKPRLTERALNLLVGYLNGAIFSRGFDDYYSNTQNDIAFNTYITFTQKLLTLPVNDRDGLLKEPIPGSDNETVESTLKASEISGKGAQGLCLTLRGVALARVVIAYKGRNHGLTNGTLVNHANEINIPHKIYPSAELNEDRGELGKVENTFLDCYEKQQLLIPSHRYALN